ncbi:MAG: asparagine synthase (glutamine-hydrolyzing) [Myxococcales bacterium]|nr:asparagine synthase (glutamine-hydrolyzing) [Myxococcales bacterium]
MCGFVGYVGLAAPVSPERLATMRDTLVHRGPDDAGLHVGVERGVAIGLGHRRLSVVDTRTVGRQPMRRGDLQIVFNGEIYNFRELREALEAEGHVFATRTDTEVLLALYQARGLDMLGLLNGMFAFALWDPAQRRLLLARDRLGIKPLVLARVGETLLFGSEIKALLASGVVDDGIDLQAHHDYLGLCYVPGPRTIVRGVEKLQPAHALVWEDGRVRQWRYWEQVLHSARPDPPRPASLGAAAEEIWSGLRAAVKRQLVADVPLGMFLSGGIDSSAVLAAMAEVHDGPVKAFTIRFEEAGFDESVQAAEVARAFGAEHHVETVRPDPDTFLGPLTEAMDEPFADSSAIPVWYLSRLTRQHVTVALGGDGGDELFAGYRTHFAWQVRELYRRLPGPVRQRLIPALVDRLPVRHGKVSFDLKARQFVAAADRAPAAAHYGYKEFLSEDVRRALLARPADVESTVRLFEAAFQEQPFRHGLDAVLHSDFGIYLPDDILAKVDRMTMRFALEARVPLLDHELVELAARLPARYKLRGATSKAVLRRALAGRVPPSVLKKRKAGFNVPMAAWLAGPLNPMLRDMLAPARVQRIGLWRPEAVMQLISEHEQRRRDHSRPLWALLCFSLFNERFRGGRPA